MVRDDDAFVARMDDDDDDDASRGLGGGARAKRDAMADSAADGFVFALDGRRRRVPYQSYDQTSPAAASSARAFFKGASRHSVPQANQMGPRAGLSASRLAAQNPISSSSNTRSVVP